MIVREVGFREGQLSAVFTRVHGVLELKEERNRLPKNVESFWDENQHPEHLAARLHIDDRNVICASCARQRHTAIILKLMIWEQISAFSNGCQNTELVEI